MYFLSPTPTLTLPHQEGGIILTLRKSFPSPAGGDEREGEFTLKIPHFLSVDNLS
jgi:hypothetical protein